MKLCLLRKMKTWAGVEAFQGRALKSSHVNETSAMCGRQFIFKDFHSPVWRNEEITIHALKLAIDFLFLPDCFNSIDRSGVTVSSQTRTLFSKQTFEFIKTIIKRVRQMRR